jgi:hypothetical protein
MNLTLLYALLLTGLASLLAVLYLAHRKHVLGWLTAWLRQDWRAPAPKGVTRHLMFCFVDHYEPQWGRADYASECARDARWRQD